MFNRVLILSASAGAGHVRAADALEKAFSQSGAAREIRHIDVLNYTNKVFRHLYSKAYLDMVNRMPEVMGWLYDHLDKPWKNERRRLALDETRMHMEKLGIHPGKLTVSGIPIDPVFSVSKDKREMRIKHGLAPDKTTILVSAGGFGVGRVEDLSTCLSELQHEAQVVVLCGRNEELKKRLDKRAAKRRPGSRRSIINIGYTTLMDEFMSASDILLGKPGGLTTSEALAKGLVFVIVNPIPGQEERNSDHLLEEGVAIRCNNLPVIAYKVDRLMDDTARLARMQASVHRLARPHAARDIVNKLLDLHHH